MPTTRSPKAGGTCSAQLRIKSLMLGSNSHRFTQFRMSDKMILRTFSKNAAKEIASILGTLIVLVMGFGIVLKILNWALQYRWLLPFVALALVAFLLYLGFKDLTSKEAGSFPLKKGLAIFILMVLTAVSAFGALSPFG